MVRGWIAWVAVILMSAGNALAHFSFVVPQPAGNAARLILSEGLRPEGDVDVAILGGAKLVARDAAGRETPLTLR